MQPGMNQLGMQPSMQPFPGQTHVPQSGGQTPETVPVGLMASMLRQVSRRGKDLHTAFVPYKPLDPTYTPQALPPTAPPSERLLGRLQEFYDSVGDAAKPPPAPAIALGDGSVTEPEVATTGKRSRSRSRSGSGSYALALAP